MQSTMAFVTGTSQWILTSDVSEFDEEDHPWEKLYGQISLPEMKVYIP
jgi:hypothetical protein